MSFSTSDYLVFIAFILAFVLFIVYSIRKKQSASTFFYGGKNIHWFVIGMSLIATDVSIGYIIGSAGIGYEKGLAVGSYSWTASIAMIAMAIYILPKFMRLEILTLPEYLEHRYNKTIRLSAACIMLLLNIVGLSSMFYSSAILIEKAFVLDHCYFYWLIWGAGLVASGIILSGGLQSIFKADVILAVLVLSGGAIVTIFCFVKIGGFENFVTASESKVISILPAGDDFLPWTQVFLGSLWLLHINYWAFNQSLMQKLLVSKSLSHAQKGILFAASVKLIIPFLFVVPGIIGYQILGGNIEKADHIFPLLLHEVVPSGLKGLVIVALSASIIGVTNAILNASSTIFAHDVYKRFLNASADNTALIKVSRIAIAATITVSCATAPVLDHYQHIFSFSQQIRSMFAPAILSIFLLGLFSHRTPPLAATAALLCTVPVYLYIKYLFPVLSNADTLGLVFLCIGAVMLAIRYWKPLQEALILEGKNDIRFERNLVVVIWSIFIATTLASIYIIFI